MKQLFLVSVAIGTGAGRRGRHGDSAARRAVRASSYVSVPVTTRRPATAAECVWGRAGTKGKKENVKKDESNMFIILLSLLYNCQSGMRLKVA